jgi:hypothetical protein
VRKTYHSQDGHPLGVESLPVGLTEANMVLLEQVCLEELELKLANKDFVNGICCFRTSEISRSILETVFQYYHTMPMVSQPYHQQCLLLILKIETSAHPLHSPTSFSNTLHQQSTYIYRLFSQNDSLSYPIQMPRCRILFFATAESPAQICHLQIVSTAGHKGSQ